MLLFAYKGEDTPMPIDRKTKAFLASFMLGGIGLCAYSAFQLMSSFSMLYLFGFLIGLIISACYGFLWRLIHQQVFHPAIMEVYSSHVFLKKYNEDAKSYEEWNYPIGQIHIIIERRLESYRGTLYMTPALHLYDRNKEESRELFFDRDETIDLFLKAFQEAGGEMRFLAYSLDYCTREERLKAFREESVPLSFSGCISQYVPRDREAYFYSERLEYKDLLLKRQKEQRTKSAETEGPSFRIK